MDRRAFLQTTSAAGLSVYAKAAASPRSAANDPPAEKGYTHRIAFNAWINDVRNESMPQATWPYSNLDDETVDSTIRALDVQSEYGYNVVDILGFWTSFAWPIDIRKVVDKDRERRINRIIEAAHERKMKVICFPSGIMNWGFDEIIKHDPAVRAGANRHNMNPLREESWQWQNKIFDFVMDNYGIDGFHLESADLGRCRTRECVEKWPNDVAYHCHMTQRMANHIQRKKPELMLMATMHSFTTYGKGFTDEEKTYLVELSRHVDGLFDQGHGGNYVSLPERPNFISRLHCAYGTSGGIWVYPPQRWDRTRWFLPYTAGTGKLMKELHDAGGRGVMYYQGPVMNPGTEVNMAFGGQFMKGVDRSVEDVLARVLESLYRPKNPEAHRKLVKIFQRAEEVYFSQWNAERILEARKRPQPGELHLIPGGGVSPGPATYLMEPFLDTDGRRAYKAGLGSLLKDTLSIEKEFNDNGRVGRIRKGIEETLVDINNIAMTKGEKNVWDDSPAEGWIHWDSVRKI